MLGYLPTNKARREIIIGKKRKEYLESVKIYFDENSPAGRDHDDIARSSVAITEERTDQELELLRQIKVDLPRTTPELPFFHHKPIQLMMERILYIWSVRHPASGYVQGMNDILTPLLLIAAQPFIGDGNVNDNLGYDNDHITLTPQDVLR